MYWWLGLLLGGLLPLLLLPPMERKQRRQMARLSPQHEGVCQQWQRLPQLSLPHAYLLSWLAWVLANVLA